jgi:hypothetical protein
VKTDGANSTLLPPPGDWDILPRELDAMRIRDAESIAKLSRMTACAASEGAMRFEARPDDLKATPVPPIRARRRKTLAVAR